MREWPSDKVSVTVSKLSIYFPHIIRCFHLHYAMLCLTNVNVDAPLTQVCGFCNVTYVGKSFPVLYRFDKSRTCTNDPNLIDLSDVKCLFSVIVYPCFPRAGFDAIFY